MLVNIAISNKNWDEQCSQLPRTIAIGCLGQIPGLFKMHNNKSCWTSLHILSLHTVFSDKHNLNIFNNIHTYLYYALQSVS